MTVELVSWARTLLSGFNVLVLVYFVVLNGSYLGLTLVAFRSLRRYSLRMEAMQLDDFTRSLAMPPVTLIAPAYNEEATCVEAVRALLALEYPEYTVVVVNDGSQDQTLERLRAAYDLEPAQIGRAHV